MIPKKMHHYMGNKKWEDWVLSQGNILLHWRLGEASLSSAAADASGNGRDGTYVQTAKMTAGVTGLVKGDDTCVSWDAATTPQPYVGVADAADALSPQQVSYEFVLDAMPADSTDRAMINKNQAVGIAIAKRQTQVIRVYVGGATNYAYKAFTDATPFTSRTHWLIVYDGTQAAADRVAVYKDGASVGAMGINGTIPSTITGGGANFIAGNATSAPFLGSLDEVIVHGEAKDSIYALESYNRALP